MNTPTTMINLSDLVCYRRESIVWAGFKGAEWKAPKVEVETARTSNFTDQSRAYIRSDNYYNVGITLV